jgi:predicted aspartyl protease
MKKYLFIALAFIFLSSCNNNSGTTPPLKLPSQSKVGNKNEVRIEYREVGGVKTIPVRINGVTMDMIYDTGCSGLHMSLNELQTLVKNGTIYECDFVGFTNSTIADGSVANNLVVNLHTIEIAPNLRWHNIEATVSLNQTAPLLLGNGVLDKMAMISVDNKNKTINFTKY